MTKRGLGKGLSALIPTIGPVEGAYVQQVSVESIVPNPHQPRKRFDEDAFGELVASIKEVGLVQPVVVRPIESGFELIAGERRWKAAQAAGLTIVPAVIKDSSDSESLEIALIENLQREDLNAIDEANAYLCLTKMFKMKQDEVAKKVGKNRATVTNILRLLQLNPGVQQLVIDGQVSSGHARALLAIEDEEQQLKIARKIVEQGLTVRQVEEIARLYSVKTEEKKKEAQPRAFKDIAERLSQAFAAKVNVKMVGKKAKIEMSFPLAQLNEVVGQLLKEQSKDNMQ